MQDVKLVEKILILPEKPTPRRRIFLSNIDLGLVVYQESVSFFDPPNNNMTLSDSCTSLYRAVASVLVPYDFFAGRLAKSSQDRFEIDCNGAGVVVAAAKTDTHLSQLGELSGPKSEFPQLVAFLHEEGEEEMDLKCKPLLHIQLTQFGCGSLALASRYNHCVMDGVAVREFEKNLAALTRGLELMIEPNPDRIWLKARNPPRIHHPHHEYTLPCNTNSVFTVSGTSAVAVKNSAPPNKAHLIYIPAERIASLKNTVLGDGKFKNCSTFQVLAAKIWKARSIAVKMKDETNSTILFPVDTRKIMVPPAPNGFAGNALAPGFARASVRELKECEDSYLVQKVQEGIQRLDDEYVRSGIDWLEVHKGVPCWEDSFSLVAWFRLGLEEDVFSWGRLKFASPVVMKPGLVVLLPGQGVDGGINICLELPDDQAEEFHRLLME